MARTTLLRFALISAFLMSTDTGRVKAANMRSFIETVRRKAPVVSVGPVKEVRLCHTNEIRHQSSHNLPYTSISQRPKWQAVKARCVSQFGAEKLNNETPLTAYDAAA